MDEKDLRTIIEQVLSEMNVGGAAAPAVEAACAKACEASNIEDGCIPDITEVDIRTQYLVENPEHGEEYAELKFNAPCRLGIGKAGARYKTLPKLSPEAVATIKEKCKKNPTVQIYVSDGLSSASVAANIPDLLPAILQGLQNYKIDVGTPFFVKYGRVGVMDEISEVTGADVTCTLIGERPAYIAYKAPVGMPEARRTVVSNIHKAGTIPAEAGAHIADIIKIMLEKKASGTDLKL